MPPIYLLLSILLFYSRSPNTEDLRKTTDISKYMLRNAVKGAIYEPIEKILSAGNRYEMLEHIIDLLSIGHSSGAAFSLGVITGLMISM
jgi:hypothetical protein